MSSNSLHTTAFVLSLIGGFVILIGSIIALVLYSFDSPSDTFYGMGSGMMRNFGFYGYSSGWMIALTVGGLVSGIIVLIGAIMLNVRPREHVIWGILVLVFSVASFVGMGGYFIGAILGIAGGAIALTYKTN